MAVDALLEQTGAARSLVGDKQPHDVMTVKENPPSVRDSLAALEPRIPPPVRTLDRGPGRIETRVTRITTALNAGLHWPGLAQVFCVDRHATALDGTHPRDETACGLTDATRGEAGAAPWPRWSPAAQRAALQRLTRDSFRGVATGLGVGEGCLRRLVDTPGPLDDDTWWAHPGDLVLSIDEASFRGTDLCLPIALLAPERRVLTIWADDRIATLAAWFARIPPDGRARIRGGGIDMKAAYRKAIQRACSHAQVLVDPFHIVKDGTPRRDAARRDEQTVTHTSIRRWPRIKGVEHLRPHPAAALATIQATDPTLGALHRLKED